MSDYLPLPPKTPMVASRPETVALWWKQFYEPLYRMLGKPGGIPGTAIDLAAFSLSQLGTRWHSMLQKVFGADVTNTGQVIEDASHVKHVSDAQAQKWEQGADAVNASIVRNIVRSGI